MARRVLLHRPHWALRGGRCQLAGLRLVNSCFLEAISPLTLANSSVSFSIKALTASMWFILVFISWTRSTSSASSLLTLSCKACDFFSQLMLREFGDCCLQSNVPRFLFFGECTIEYDITWWGCKMTAKFYVCFPTGCILIAKSHMMNARVTYIQLLSWENEMRSKKKCHRMEQCAIAYSKGVYFWIKITSKLVIAGVQMTVTHSVIRVFHLRIKISSLSRRGRRV